MPSKNISDKIPVIIRYSFDSYTPVLLFDTEEDATDYIRKDFQRECDIDTKENGHIISDDMEACIEDDGSYAKIINRSNYPDTDDAITEWFIGTIMNPSEMTVSKDKE